MPPRSMIKPARMKNGTASRMKLPVPLTMLCGSTTIDAVPVIHMYAAVASSSTKPTGTPAKIATKKNSNAAVMAASAENHACHVSRVSIATASSSANAPATFQAILPCWRHRWTIAYRQMSAMPTGSGEPMIAAGSCSTGVRSFQLEARNSSDAMPVRPATNRTRTSASAMHARCVRAEQRLRTTRTKA